MPGDQLTPVMTLRLGPRPARETVAMNAEGEFDHARHAAGFAEAAIVGECSGIAARRLHQAIEMVLADDAEIGGPHRLAVLLERRQQLGDVVGVRLMQSEKIMQRDVRSAGLGQHLPSASRCRSCRETREMNSRTVMLPRWAMCAAM